MRKVLLLGSEGNIGKPLGAYLRQCGYGIKECDIRPGWREDFYVADINHPIDLLPVFAGSWAIFAVWITLHKGMGSPVFGEDAAGAA